MISDSHVNSSLKTTLSTSNPQSQMTKAEVEALRQDFKAAMKEARNQLLANSNSIKCRTK